MLLSLAAASCATTDAERVASVATSYMEAYRREDRNAVLALTGPSRREVGYDKSIARASVVEPEILGVEVLGAWAVVGVRMDYDGLPESLNLLMHRRGGAWLSAFGRARNTLLRHRVPAAAGAALLVAAAAWHFSRPATLASWEIPDTFRRIGLPVPEEARARMAPGGAYRVRVVDTAGKDVDASELRLLADGELAAVAADIATLEGKFEPGDVALAFLRADVLLARGLHEDAYEEAVQLQGRVGPRREVARLALAILDQAGLRGRGWWGAWVNIHHEAQPGDRKEGE
jgi:hypothetical protein